MNDYNNLLSKAKDNLEVAKYSENKKYYDVAISRYYYYIFQNIIVFLGKNYKEFNISDNDCSHKETIDFLIEKITSSDRKMLR